MNKERYTVKYDNKKLSVVTDIYGYIIAWNEPFIIDGELKPSLENSIIISKHELQGNTDIRSYKYKNGELIYCKDKELEIKRDKIRQKRSQEFSLFDKYQLIFVMQDLSHEQIEEYKHWREMWLDAPETLNIPNRPNWFELD